MCTCRAVVVVMVCCATSRVLLLRCPVAERHGVTAETGGGGAVSHDDAQHQGHDAGRQPHRGGLSELHHRCQLRGARFRGETPHFAYVHFYIFGNSCTKNFNILTFFIFCIFTF